MSHVLIFIQQFFFLLLLFPLQFMKVILKLSRNVYVLIY